MRQIDNMDSSEIETLRVKGMLADPRQSTIDRKRVEIQLSRIDACDTLITHIMDDIPHKDQQPLLDLLRTMRGNLEDEMFDAITP